MKIFTDPIFDDSFDFTSPLLLSGDGGLGDLGGGGGVGVADGGDAADAGEKDVGISQGDLGGEGEGVVPEGEAPTEGEEAGEAGRTGEGGEPQADAQAQAGPTGQSLPKELSKAIRELKSAHADSPEMQKAIKTLNDSYYTTRSYREVFPTVDEARTTKAALEAAGGHEGISQMRDEISSIENFDRMAQEGDPQVIRGLAEQFPEGFQKLVPAALDTLSKSNPEAYREAMRGPLLSVLEGDGVIGVIGAALNRINAVLEKPDDPSARFHTQDAKSQLDRIAAWYNQLSEAEKAFKTRYQDPKLQQLEQQRKSQDEREANIYRKSVIIETNRYLSDTMRPEVNRLMAGKSPTGVTRFVKSVQEEVRSALVANPTYARGINALIRKGDTEGATNFAKPFIDSARRTALQSVYTDFYGTAAVVKPGVRPTAPGARPNDGQSRPVAAASDKPVPIRSKPAENDVDWSKDPKGVLFITNKAYLKSSGKFVSWA